MNAESKLLLTEGSATLGAGFTGLGDALPMSESMLKTGLWSGGREVVAVTGTGLQGSVVCAELPRRFSPRESRARSAGGSRGTAGGRGER